MSERYDIYAAYIAELTAKCRANGKNEVDQNCFNFQDIRLSFLRQRDIFDRPGNCLITRLKYIALSTAVGFEDELKSVCPCEPIFFY